MQGIHSHESSNLDKVGQAECFLELVVERIGLARDIDVGPELFLDFVDFLDGGLQALSGTTHSYEVPHDETQLFVDAIHRAFALNGHQFLNLSLYSFLSLGKLGQVGAHARHANLVAEVVLDGVRQYEISVGQTLHQCRSAQTVGSVVGEVGLADAEQTLDRCHEFVVHPDTTHGVVDSGEDHHRVLVRVLIHDFLVHLEEVAVFLSHHVLAQTLDSFGEVEEHSQSGVVHAEASVASLFGST